MLSAAASEFRPGAAPAGTVNAGPSGTEGSANLLAKPRSARPKKPKSKKGEGAAVESGDLAASGGGEPISGQNRGAAGPSEDDGTSGDAKNRRKVKAMAAPGPQIHQAAPAANEQEGGAVAEKTSAKPVRNKRQKKPIGQPDEEAMAGASSAALPEGCSAGAGGGDATDAEPKVARNRRIKGKGKGKDKDKSKDKVPNLEAPAGGAESLAAGGDAGGEGLGSRAAGKGAGVKVGAQKGKKKVLTWWRTLQDDDPISLEPLAALRYEPFNLPASEGIPAFFDPRMLANYLVSAANFAHPLNRRPLTRDECAALDAHIARCRLRPVGVAEVFEATERAADPQQRIADLRAQAAAIMESFFNPAGRSDAARRGGRGAGAEGAGSGRGAGRGGRLPARLTDADVGWDDVRFIPGEEGAAAGGFVIDDDLDPYPDGSRPPPGAARAGAPRRAPAPTGESWPGLGGAGYQPQAPVWVPPPRAAAPAARERAGIKWPAGMHAVLMVQPLGDAKSVKTRHVRALFAPLGAEVKWLGPNNSVAMVEGTEQQALARVAAYSGDRKFCVVTLRTLEESLGPQPTQRALVDYNGRPGVRVMLPSIGELRFVVLAMHTQVQALLAESREGSARRARQRGSDSEGGGSDEEYEEYLRERWRAHALAKGAEGGVADTAMAGKGAAEGTHEEEGCEGATGRVQEPVGLRGFAGCAELPGDESGTEDTSDEDSKGAGGEQRQWAAGDKSAVRKSKKVVKNSEGRGKGGGSGR